MNDQRTSRPKSDSDTGPPWIKILRRPLVQIGLFGLLLLLLRLSVFATNLNDMHTIYPEETQQLQFTKDYLRYVPILGGHRYHYLTNLFSNVYLPPSRQFHGVLLLNNALLFAMYFILGFHYYSTQLLAILYALVTYVFWALLLRRQFGGRAFLFFSLLYVFAPQEFVSKNLYLMGCHPESAAFAAILYFLVFYNDRPFGKYLFFLSFGLFFFLYKGILVALPLLMFPAVVALRHDRKKFWLLLLFALGFVPMVLFQYKYGFFSHYLIDGHFDEPNVPTWFNALRLNHFRWSTWHLPALDFNRLQIPYLSKSLYVWIFLFCFLYLAATSIRRVQVKYRRWVNTNRPQDKILPAFLLYAPLHLLLLSLITAAVEPRYYIPLYSFVFIIVALGLSRLPRKLGLAGLLVLLFFLIPDNLVLIKPRNGLLFLRYDGDKYYSAQINYVPADEIGFVDWWLAHCPDNRGFRSFYKLFETQDLVRPEILDLNGYTEELRSLTTEGDPPASQVRAVGLALGVRLKQNAVVYRRLLDDLGVPAPTQELLTSGFEQSAGYAALAGCP